jgi:hypothetical protein
LNGEDFSSVGRDATGAKVVTSVTDNDVGLLVIFGFSARLIGGGPLMAIDGSLLISPERRGGGGEGGRDVESLGDLVESINGVCGRLGILKCRGVLVPDAGVLVSLDSRVVAFDKVKLVGLDFGGE